MRQVTVPQFIDVEDKIIGPVTVRQFLILIVAGLIMFIEYKLSDMVLFILLAIPTALVFGTIAFLKVNGMPFHYFILNLIQTFKKPNLRVWSREAQVQLSKKELTAKELEPEPIIAKKPLIRSRLSDISLIIDTGGIYEGEEAKIVGFVNSEENKNKD